MYVYLIQEHKPSIKAPIKIGVAVNTQRRLKELQTGNPRELVIVAIMGPMLELTAFELESALHARFHNYRLRGEWFSGKVLVKLVEGRYPLPVNTRIQILDYLHGTHDYPYPATSQQALEIWANGQKT